MDLCLSRDGYMDCTDEWAPVNSWSGSAVVLDSVDPALRVRLDVRVHGSWKKKGCRPRSWRAELRVHNVTLKVGNGKCRTLRDTIAQVKKLDLQPHIREVLKTFYSKERAICVWADKRSAFPTHAKTLYDRSRWDCLTDRTGPSFVPFVSAFIDLCPISYFGTRIEVPGRITEGQYVLLYPGYGTQADVNSYYAEKGGLDKQQQKETYRWTKNGDHLPEQVGAQEADS